MPLETLRLDRVFGVVQTSNRRRYVTLFGFESGNLKEYSVEVFGTPRVESGMTITAYLAEAGNWQTLEGWRDHETGEIVCEPETGPWLICGGSVLAFCMIVPGLWNQSGALATALAALALLAVFAWGVQSLRYLRRVRRDLEASMSPINAMWNS